MILSKTPFRVSLFGGSTDYEDYYSQNGSLLIGFTINKYVYISIRDKPKILSQTSTISYSKLETPASLTTIENPLIRETFKYFNFDQSIELISFSDIPSRSGLGGSSSYCVGLSYLLSNFTKTPYSKKQLAKDAIHIERTILNEPGGIQDQIWASYGGVNSIEIHKNGDFSVKPLPLSTEFSEELKNCITLIYSNGQRESNNIAKSHEKKDKGGIHDLARIAYSNLLGENIPQIGKLLHLSWLEKSKISPQISTSSVGEIIDKAMSLGAYGAKLLGAGGGGFVLVMSDPIVKRKLSETFKDHILDFDFDYEGVSTIFENK